MESFNFVWCLSQRSWHRGWCGGWILVQRTWKGKLIWWELYASVPLSSPCSLFSSLFKTRICVDLILLKFFGGEGKEMYHWVKDYCILLALMHNLGLINTQRQFFDCQGFCLERLLCDADVKCKCNTTQIWNKAEPFKLTHLLKEWQVRSICSIHLLVWIPGKRRTELILFIYLRQHFRIRAVCSRCECDYYSSWSSVVTACCFSHLNLLLL